MQVNQQQIRPLTFDEFKGKESLKKNLMIYIESSIKRETPLDHILLHGLPGTGKTTLAHIITNYFDKKIKIIQVKQQQRACACGIFLFYILQKATKLIPVRLC